MVVQFYEFHLESWWEFYPPEPVEMAFLLLVQRGKPGANANRTWKSFSNFLVCSSNWRSSILFLLVSRGSIILQKIEVQTVNCNTIFLLHGLCYGKLILNWIIPWRPVYFVKKWETEHLQQSYEDNLYQKMCSSIYIYGLKLSSHKNKI